MGSSRLMLPLVLLLGGCALNADGLNVFQDDAGVTSDGTPVHTPTPAPMPGPTPAPVPTGAFYSIPGPVVLDGIKSIQDFSAVPNLNFAASDQYTIEGFVQIPTTENYGPLVSMRKHGDDNPIIDITIGQDGAGDAAGHLMALIRADGGGGVARVVGPTINDGKWHHYALTRDGDGTIELFVDGVSKGTAGGGGGSITTDWRALGSDQTWVESGFLGPDQWYLTGTEQQVNFYKRKLTNAELQIRAASFVITTPTPVPTPAGVVYQMIGPVSFDGVKTFQDFSDTPDLNFAVTDAFTIEGLALVPTDENYGPLISMRKHDDDNPVIDVTVGYDGAGDSPGHLMVLLRQDGGESITRVVGPTLNDGKWHHFAVTRNLTGVLELFFDGVSQGTALGAGGSITTDRRAFGAELSWIPANFVVPDQWYLKGSEQSVSFYKRQLSATEIQQRFATLTASLAPAPLPIPTPTPTSAPVPAGN